MEGKDGTPSRSGSNDSGFKSMLSSGSRSSMNTAGDTQVNAQVLDALTPQGTRRTQSQSEDFDIDSDLNSFLVPSSSSSSTVCSPALPNKPPDPGTHEILEHLDHRFERLTTNLTDRFSEVDTRLAAVEVRAANGDAYYVGGQMRRVKTDDPGTQVILEHFDHHLEKFEVKVFQQIDDFDSRLTAVEELTSSVNGNTDDATVGAEGPGTQDIRGHIDHRFQRLENVLAQRLDGFDTRLSAVEAKAANADGKADVAVGVANSAKTQTNALEACLEHHVNNTQEHFEGNKEQHHHTGKRLEKVEEKVEHQRDSLRGVTLVTNQDRKTHSEDKKQMERNIKSNADRISQNEQNIDVLQSARDTQEQLVEEVMRVQVIQNDALERTMSYQHATQSRIRNGTNFVQQEEEDESSDDNGDTDMPVADQHPAA